MTQAGSTGTMQRVGDRCLGAFLVAALILPGCSGSSGDRGDPDYSEVCSLVRQIGREYLDDAVNDPLARLGDAAPEGTAIERITREMVALDRDVRDEAVEFAELGADLDRELATVCPGPVG